MEHSAVLIDGSFLAHRCYFGGPVTLSQSGKPNNMLRSVVRVVNRVLRTLSPKYVVFVLDSGLKNFRHELLPTYKGNRGPKPEELKAQLAVLAELIRSMGIAVITSGNYEADDVLGTLSKKFADKEIFSYIVTGDKDMMQCVNALVNVYNPFKDVIYDVEKVNEAYGVGPEGIVSLLAMIGDSADNIDGVPGVGPKYALMMMGTVAPTAIYQRCCEYSELLDRNRKLIRLCYTVELDLKPKDLIIGEYDLPTYQTYMQEYGI